MLAVSGRFARQPKMLAVAARFAKPSKSLTVAPARLQARRRCAASAMKSSLSRAVCRQGHEILSVAGGVPPVLLSARCHKRIAASAMNCSLSLVVCRHCH